MKYSTYGEEETRKLAYTLGKIVRGGEVMELVGDVGAGKTTFTKGLAQGMGIADPVQSPTFTISRVYQSPSGLGLSHYDFYRLGEAGIMANELEEVVRDKESVVVVEWARDIKSILPKDRLLIEINAFEENSRNITMTALGDNSARLLRGMK